MPQGELKAGPLHRARPADRPGPLGLVQGWAKYALGKEQLGIVVPAGGEVAPVLGGAYAVGNHESVTHRVRASA